MAGLSPDLDVEPGLFQYSQFSGVDPVMKPVPEFVLIVRSPEPALKNRIGCTVLTGLKWKCVVNINSVPDPDLMQ